MSFLQLGDGENIKQPAGESDETRFIMSRKGDEVELALEIAMKAKMAAELDASNTSQ